MKRLIIYLVIILLAPSCSPKNGASFRYKRAVVTRCKECITGENGFFIAFREPVVNNFNYTWNGVASVRIYDKYSLYTTVSKAYNEKRILKRIIRKVRKDQK